MEPKPAMVDVFNINKPGTVSRVQALPYHEMRRCLLVLLPKAPPGMTEKEMVDGVQKLLSGDIFPGGEKSGWWLKAVQLDLEARGMVKRVQGKQLRWYQDPLAVEIIPQDCKPGTPVRRTMQELPEFMRSTLSEANLLEAYLDRPDYQRNDYITWISSAKRPETKEKRLIQMREELEAGNLYMNMDYSPRK